MEKVLISKLSEEELIEYCYSLNESRFRAKQLINWVYFKFASNFDEMTDISKKFIEILKQNVIITGSKIEQKQISEDGTIKYLLRLNDGNLVETVLMRFDNRSNLTACVSSQVGCSMGCKFCATAKRGFIRNLHTFEIIEQVLLIQSDIKKKVSNIVFMGQGEPLLNLVNVLNAINIFNERFNISKRRMTVSTCGLIDKIEKLIEIDFEPTLAISLHASNSKIRREIMPIENKYNIKDLIKTIKRYNKLTKKRVTIEYTLIKGINDSLENALQLNDLIKDLKVNINLILYNPCGNDIFKRPERLQVMKFKSILEAGNKKVTIRLERGKDIDAACGQLSGKVSMEAKV